MSIYDELSAATPYKLVFATGAVPASCAVGTELVSGTAMSFTHSGLANGTTYYYRLCAIDAVGNVSGGAFNPAVYLAGSILGLFSWSNALVYLGAQLVGGAAAALLFKAVHPK